MGYMGGRAAGEPREEATGRTRNRLLRCSGHGPTCQVPAWNAWICMYALQSLRNIHYDILRAIIFYITYPYLIRMKAGVITRVQAIEGPFINEWLDWYLNRLNFLTAYLINTEDEKTLNYLKDIIPDELKCRCVFLSLIHI